MALPKKKKKKTIKEKEECWEKSYTLKDFQKNLEIIYSHNLHSVKTSLSHTELLPSFTDPLRMAHLKATIIQLELAYKTKLI